MTRAKVIAVAVCLTAIWLATPAALGEETITTYQWTGGASPPANWQVSGNWNISGFPNDALAGADIPSAADLTLNIGTSAVTVAQLTMNGTSADTDINIVAGTGGKLILDNSDDNTFFVGSGDRSAFVDEEGVNHGRVYVTSNGAAGSTNTITAPIGLRNNGWLEGVDFFGNTSITLAGDIDIAGVVPPTPWPPDPPLDWDDTAQLRSFLPAGTKLLITGNIVLNDAVEPTYPRNLWLNTYNTTDLGDCPTGTIEISGNISGVGTEDMEAATITIGNVWEYHTEQEGYDRADRHSLPLSTVIISGDNSGFEGDWELGHANTVIRSDTAFGSGGSVTQVGEKADKMEVGVNLVIDAGDRTISDKRLAIARWLTIKGTDSLTWNGQVDQTNSYGIINLLPHDMQADTGEAVTLNGPVWCGRRQETPPKPGRIITFDGTGKTIISGGVHNTFDDYDPEGDDDPVPWEDVGQIGSLRKRGTGSVVVDFSEAHTATGDSASDYHGHTWMEGGNLHFATDADMPDPGPGVWESGSGKILSRNGAVGVDTGVVSNATFLGMLNNSSSPLQNTSAPFFLLHNAQNAAVFTIYGDGGMMLGSSEYGSSLDFTSGDLARAANMSLAAHETGSTYTGTITPSTTIAVNKNTYMLGGGSGTLTLPNQNQLTGSNGLLATNGGEVLLANTNNYTGKTRVTGKYSTSLSEDAAFGTADSDLDGEIPGIRDTGEAAGRYIDESQEEVFSTTLTVTSLANGGSDSSIGKSSNIADNLVVQGSTLKYVGASASTDRLFTVGTYGATIDASGSGAVNFSNAGALTIDTAENRWGVMRQDVNGTDNNEVFGMPTQSYSGSQLLFNTDDLTPGMAIRDLAGGYGSPQQLIDDDSPLVIEEIAGSHVVRVREADLTADWDEEGVPPEPNPTVWDGITSASPTYIHTIDFGPAPARMLTLSGSNTGNNTLTPTVGDAADRDEAWTIGGVSTPMGGAGGNGSVGIAKTGTGKWVLAGANTYTGVTSVEEGTLILAATGTTGYGDTTVAADATLGGSGTVRGSLIADGIVAPGTSPGTLSVLGDYAQNEGATLAIDIAGSSAYDVLDVTGTADLAGLIDVVLDSFTPTLLDEFDVLLASAVTDSGLALTTAADELWDLTIGADVVTLVYNPDIPMLIGDYNEDDVVDAADYTVWRDNVGESTLPNRDPENSGPIGEDDWASWKAHFGETGGGSGSLAGAGAVPEPSTLLLAGLAVLVMTGWARRR